MGEWRDNPGTVVGWLGIGCAALVIGVDIFLAISPTYITFSQYVHLRSDDQPVFAYITMGLIIWLFAHWFLRFFRR